MLAVQTKVERLGECGCVCTFFDRRISFFSADNFVAVASLQPFDFKGFVVMTVMAVQQTIPKGCAKHNGCSNFTNIQVADVAGIDAN